MQTLKENTERPSDSRVVAMVMDCNLSKGFEVRVHDQRLWRYKRHLPHLYIGVRVFRGRGKEGRGGEGRGGRRRQLVSSGVRTSERASHTGCKITKHSANHAVDATNSCISYV